MTSHQQKPERTNISLRVPSEVWQTSDDGCDDDAIMVQKKDFQNNSDAVDDSWAYDPDFETSEDVDLAEEIALENSYALHEIDGHGGYHSPSSGLLPYSKGSSPTSVISQSTAESRISFVSSPHSVSQSDPQADRHEMSSDSESLMQSSRGDSCVAVTPLSFGSAPRKVISNSYSNLRTDAKHSTSYLENSEIRHKPRDSRFAHQRFSETGVRVQNLKFESQSEKNLNSFQSNPRYIASQKSSSDQKQKHTSSQQYFQKDGIYDWGSCSDQEFSKEEDHSGSDKCFLDHQVKGNQLAPTKASSGAQRRMICGASDFDKISFDESKDLFNKSHPDNCHDFQNDRAERTEPATEISSYLPVTGQEMRDRTDKTTENYCIQSQMGDDLRWRNSTEKILENGRKHSAFDLALVLSQPELSVHAPQFKPEDLENYSQLSQTMLKEKIIRLAALLQACRDVIAWNKEERQQLLAEREALRKEQAECARNLEEHNKQILNKSEECRNLKAEKDALKEALRKETLEKVANKEEFKKQMDKMGKDKAKSEEDFIRLLGVAKELKMELRNVRHELVRKEEEFKREMIQREAETRREMRDEIILKEDQMRLELMRKEEAMCHEVESLQMMLETEKERHIAEEESTQRELSAYKESIKQKLDEAEQKVAWRMEQLQEECQSYMLSIRQKGKHSKPTFTQETEQNNDPSIAEHDGSRPASALLSGRRSAVLVSPLTESPYYQELVSRVSADSDAVLNQPKRSAMFSSAKSPLTKVRLVSSVSTVDAPLSSRAQLPELNDHTRKYAVDET